MDYRERDLLLALRHAGADAHAAALPLGDAVVGEPSAAPSAGPAAPFIVVERKGAADLAASIKDGRWREQVARMRKWCPANGRCFVVVEGLGGPGLGDGELINGVRAGSLRSALLGAALSGIHVHHTADAAGTAAFLVRAAAKMGAAAARRGRAEHTAAAAATLAAAVAAMPRRAEDWSPRALAEAQLSLVPGVSLGVAAKVLGAHDTLEAWLRSLPQGRGAAVEAISQVRCGRAGRRLGPKVGGRLAELLLPKVGGGWPEPPP